MNVFVKYLKEYIDKLASNIKFNCCKYQKIILDIKDLEIIGETPIAAHENGIEVLTKLYEDRKFLQHLVKKLRDKSSSSESLFTDEKTFICSNPMIMEMCKLIDQKAVFNYRVDSTVKFNVT